MLYFIHYWLLARQARLILPSYWGLHIYLQHNDHYQRETERRVLISCFKTTKSDSDSRPIRSPIRFRKGNRYSEIQWREQGCFRYLKTTLSLYQQHFAVHQTSKLHLMKKTCPNRPASKHGHGNSSPSITSVDKNTFHQLQHLIYMLDVITISWATSFLQPLTSSKSNVSFKRLISIRKHKNVLKINSWNYNLWVSSTLTFMMLPDILDTEHVANKASLPVMWHEITSQQKVWVGDSFICDQTPLLSVGGGANVEVTMCTLNLLLPFSSTGFSFVCIKSKYWSRLSTPLPHLGCNTMGTTDSLDVSTLKDRDSYSLATLNT